MDTSQKWDWIVIGGGAAGFFGAINLARKGQKVLILEKFQKVLSKLAVSGGGRCNVTHHLFDPKKLIQFYPRGSKALLGPFYRFGPEEMIRWLEEAGVELKTEPDGRMFPTTDSSSTIIDCFVHEAQKAGAQILKGIDVTDIHPHTGEVVTSQGSFLAEKILIASGSSKAIWEILTKLEIKMIPPTPSLFALNTPGSKLNSLSGLSLKEAGISLNSHHFVGPMLFTHFGLSGPAVLKLSSFGSKELFAKNYKAEIFLDFMPKTSVKELEDFLNLESNKKPAKTLKQLFQDLPKRLLETLAAEESIPLIQPLNHLSKVKRGAFIKLLKNYKVLMDGKTTHKEEFVTAGGVDLNEIDFKTMQCKRHPRLYFAGEVLDIDGVTGGFNFQAAWTTSMTVAFSENPNMLKKS